MPRTWETFDHVHLIWNDIFKFSGDTENIDSITEHTQTFEHI